MNVHHILATVIYVDWYSHDFILMTTALLSDFLSHGTFKLFKTIASLPTRTYTHFAVNFREFTGTLRPPG